MQRSVKKQSVIADFQKSRGQIGVFKSLEQDDITIVLVAVRLLMFYLFITTPRVGV